MKTKLSVLCVLLLMAALMLGTAQAITLPDQLRELDTEALSGTALTGVITLPDSMETVGDHVLDQANLYAVIVPENIVSLGAHDFDGNMAYVMLLGDSTLGNNLTGMRYLFCAEETNIPGAFDLNSLVNDGQFWYLRTNGALTVLCAVDNLALPAQVSIPYAVDGTAVRWLADDFLMGCDQVTDVSLPCTVVEVNPGAFSARPDVRVTSRPGVELWWAEATDSVNSSLVNRYLTDHPEYADWELVITTMGEGDAAYYVREGWHPDLYCFAQDQLAWLAQAGGLSEVPSAYRGSVLVNDASIVEAITQDSELLAYPITSDNGYFLYYDKDIITNPGNLETILYDCERAGCTFHMELTSGWYNVAFFYGAGCELYYDYADGRPIAFHGNLASANGLKALRAMIKVASWPYTFVNGSSADTDDRFMGALVSGIWDTTTISEKYPQFSATKLPTVDGFQMGSFGGFKLIGVKDNGDADRLALAHAFAAALSSAEAQAQRQNDVGWLASNPQARSQADISWSAYALAAQQPYAVPQPQIPNGYWDIAAAFGAHVVAGDYDDMTDEQLMEVLQQYQSDLAALVQQ